jgi:hypothetical protein
MLWLAAANPLAASLVLAIELYIPWSVDSMLECVFADEFISPLVLLGFSVALNGLTSIY